MDDLGARGDSGKPSKSGRGLGVRQGKEGSQCKSLWVMWARFRSGPSERVWSASQDRPTKWGGGI